MDGVDRIESECAVETGDPAPANARSRQRDSLFLTANLRFADEAEGREVRVRNLSAGGLMVELERIVAPDTAVRLDMRNLGELSGTVAWCTQGRIGIALDHPIDPRRARKPVGTGAQTPNFAKPMLVARAPRRR